MKAQSKVSNDTAGEWGFKKPIDGWHVVEMLEGIDLMKYREDKDNHKAGDIVMDKKGEKAWAFPAKINDENDETNNSRLNQIIYENNFGEQKIADILAGVGLLKKFEENFPGDRSFFEAPIMDKLKIALPGKFCKMKTEINKDGNVNVIAIAPLAFKPEDKAAGKKKDDKKTEASGADKQAGKDW